MRTYLYIYSLDYVFSGLALQLQTVANKMNENDSLDLDELDSLFNNLSV